MWFGNADRSAEIPMQCRLVLKPVRMCRRGEREDYARARHPIAREMAVLVCSSTLRACATVTLASRCFR